MRSIAHRSASIAGGTLAALALAGLLAACSDDGGGGSDNGAASTTTTSSTPELSDEEEAALETEVEHARCMRENGIEGLPEPQVDENGFVLVGFPLVLPANWDAAAEACQQIFDDAAPPDPGADGAADAAAGWERVVPGGDCECADGSEFAFWERRADPTKVVLFLDGGGTCADAASCAFTTPGEYDWHVGDEDPAGDGGIFDFVRADNPFVDYSFIYVPSCTGDVHLGDATREYSPDLTVEHNGFVNGTAALSYLAEHYPDAAQVVVVGKTQVAAPVYGGLVADLVPDAHVTVFGAQSGHISDDPELNAELGELWGAYDNMPDWDVNEGLTARDWGAVRFWIQTGLHNPEIALARFDYAYDQAAAEGAESRGLDPSDLLAVIDANEAAIEAAGVVQRSYTAPGDDHGITDTDRFYEVEVNGVTLVDWVTKLIAGESVEDVHCTECTSG